MASPQFSFQVHGSQILLAFTGLVQKKSSIYFRSRHVENGKWNEILPISGPYGSDTNPSLWVDSGGALHCVWLKRIRRKQHQVQYSRMKAGGSEWTAPRTFSAGKLSNRPYLLGDSGGNLYLYFWNRTNQDKWGRVFVYVSRDGGRSWSLSDPNFPSQIKKGQASDPVLALDSKNQVYLVWLDQTPGGKSVVFNRSRDAGRTWLEEPMTLNSDKRFALSRPWLSILQETLCISWAVVLVTSRGQRTELWVDLSQDEGQSWQGNQKVYSGPVTEVEGDFFAVKEGVALLWSENHRVKGGNTRIVEKVFWDGQRYFQSPETVLASSRPFTNFVDLQLVKQGGAPAAVVAELGQEPGRILLLVRNGNGSQWQQMELAGRDSKMDTRAPVAAFDPQRSVYTILYHEVRKQRFLMEPRIWETHLIFNQLRFNVEQAP